MEYLRQRPGWSGTRVFFDNIPAPVVYSVNGEVEAVVPDSVAGKTATKIVVEYHGERLRPLKMPVVPVAPAIFTLDASGTGQAAMLNETGCCNSPRNPAPRGSIASLYATGEGLHDSPVNVTVANTPAEVVYAGNVGMLVVNFRIPQDVPAGPSVPVVLTVGKVRSRDGVTMAIRAANQGIVIVDRDSAIRGRLNDALRGSYDVFEAGDWNHATNYAARNSIDLVILDQAMAGEAATEALHAIRNQHPLVKIIVLGQNRRPQFLRQADLLGANAVLPITATGTALVARIQTLLLERPARY